MAKVMKTTKDKLRSLLVLVDSVAPTKLASDINKHTGFRKAIKKHLKERLDQEADFRDEVAKKQRLNL